MITTDQQRVQLSANQKARRINADPEYHEEAPGQGAGDKPAGTINGNAARAGG